MEKVCKIEVIQSAGGSITASQATAKAGEIVTLTVALDNNKGLKDGTLMVNDVVLNNPSKTSGIYTFTMPDTDVTVKAEFDATFSLKTGKELNELIGNKVVTKFVYGSKSEYPDIASKVPSGVATEAVNVAGNPRASIYKIGSDKNEVYLLTDDVGLTRANADCSGMFSCCRNLTDIDLSNFDTSNVVNMSEMFNMLDIEQNRNYKLTSLTNLDLSSFNTSNVIDMSSMFNSCSDLVNLDLSNFNTNKVTNMKWMFYFCVALSSLDISNFNTSNVTNMCGMFNTCYSLKSLDLSNFNTSSVTDMSFMFYRCHFLTSLDLSSFNTSNVILMKQMFEECKSLTALDLSNFDTSNVTDMGFMFNTCESLQNIYVKTDFNVKKIFKDARKIIFDGCKSLENGFREDSISLDMAKLKENGGYFTNSSQKK